MNNDMAKELFDILNIPSCSQTACLYDLIRDLRDFSRRLEPGTEYQGVSGLVVKTSPIIPNTELKQARRFLKNLADDLGLQINKRFNQEAQRRPATILQIHWPAGAELLDIQDGTAMIQGTLVLLGNRRIAYLGSDMNSFQLSSGFFLKKEGDSLRVVESPVEEHIENGRAIVRYPRRYWAKSTAWDDLRRRYKMNTSPDWFTKENNPWRKSHDSYAHGWTAPVDLLPTLGLAGQKQHGND